MTLHLSSSPHEDSSVRPWRAIQLLLVLLPVIALMVHAQGKWVENPLPVFDSTLFQISFVDSSYGCLVGTDGIFIFTSDGGKSWTRDSIPALYSVHECRLVSHEVAWALTNDWRYPGLNYALFRSSDRGAHWCEVPLPDTMGGRAACFFSDTSAYVGGNGKLWVTTDGGQHWKMRGDIPMLVGCLEFYDENWGYAYVGAGYIASTSLFTTTDGGLTCNLRQEYGATQGSTTVKILNGTLKMMTESGVWNDISPYGYLSLSWKKDGAERSLSTYPWSTTSCHSGWATDSVNYWLLQQNGVVHRTADAGTTWINDTLPVPITELMCDV